MDVETTSCVYWVIATSDLKQLSSHINKSFSASSESWFLEGYPSWGAMMEGFGYMDYGD